jgi:hypothetical protein
MSRGEVEEKKSKKDKKNKINNQIITKLDIINK